VDYPLCVEMDEAFKYLSPSSDVLVVINGTGVDYISKSTVEHNNRGFWGLPKLKHVYHIRLRHKLVPLRSQTYRR